MKLIHHKWIKVGRMNVSVEEVNLLPHTISHVTMCLLSHSVRQMPINFSNLQRQRRIANPGDPVLLSHGHPGGSARFAIVVYCIEDALSFIGPLWKAPRPMDPKTHLHNFALVTNFSQLLQFLAVRRRHSCLSVFITILLELFAHNQNRHPDRNKQVSPMVHVEAKTIDS